MCIIKSIMKEVIIMVEMCFCYTFYTRMRNINLKISLTLGYRFFLHLVFFWLISVNLHKMNNWREFEHVITAQRAGSMALKVTWIGLGLGKRYGRVYWLPKCFSLRASVDFAIFFNNQVIFSFVLFEFSKF